MEEPIAFVADKFRGFTKSTQELVQNLIRNHGLAQSSAPQHPIEILKRLQREVFSDLMKLRDSQDKVERMVSLYATSRGSPFQEVNTLVRGEADLLGAFLFMHNKTTDEEVHVHHTSDDALRRAGMRVGIDSRFTFETSFRQNDRLVTEFVASQKHKNNLCDLSECPLSLAKVFYMANVSSWLSGIAIPVGGRGRDFEVLSSPSHQGKGLTDSSSYGPPLLNQHNGSAIGLMVKQPNAVASLAQFVSGLGMQEGSGRAGRLLSTFLQIVCQLPGGTKLSLLGLHQIPKLSSKHADHGTLLIPLHRLKLLTSPETVTEASAASPGTNSQDNVATGSIAVMLESNIDEFTKIGGWIEMKQSNPRHLEWAVSVSDDSEDSDGWGISLSGKLGGPKSSNLIQVESYMKFNLGKKFSVKPGIAHIVNGNARMTTLMVRSNWSL